MIKKYTEIIVKSQNIVEQANSNPNNISPTMSRRHIICFASDEPHKAFKVMEGSTVKVMKGLLEEGST